MATNRGRSIPTAGVAAATADRAAACLDRAALTLEARDKMLLTCRVALDFRLLGASAAYASASGVLQTACLRSA